MPGRQPVPGASPLDMSPATSAQSMKTHTARDGGNRIASGTSDRERAGRFDFKQLCSCRRSGYAATVCISARLSSARAEPAFLTSYLLDRCSRRDSTSHIHVVVRPHISVAVPDATLSPPSLESYAPSQRQPARNAGSLISCWGSGEVSRLHRAVLVDRSRDPHPTALANDSPTPPFAPMRRWR